MKPVLKTICVAGLLMASSIASAAELHYVRVMLSAPSAAVKWYGDHLGCEAVADQPRVTDCHGMRIEFVAGVTVGGSQGTGVNRIGLSVPDVEEKMLALEAVGVGGAGVRLQRFADGSLVREIPGLYNHGFIFDPWGTRIEFVDDPDHIGFHHVQLQSTDPEAAIRFYADVLGGKAGVYRDTLAGVRFGDVWLFVEKYPEVGRPAATDERAINHIAFAVEDIDTLVADMTARELNVREPAVPEHARTDARQGFVSGPDGVLIALVEPNWQGTQEEQFVGLVAEEDTTPYETPLTPWGEPDLQGMWSGNSSHGIPLEKPEELEGDELSAEQAASRRERGTLGSIWGYEREWRDTTLGYVKTAPSRQVAMIIDPPSGRMPPMTELGKERYAKLQELRYNRPLAGGPEDLSTWVRCITQGLPSMMMPRVYNNGLQISQSPGYVAIQKEMIHETRVIPTTPKPPLGENIKQWLGHSRGYWDGDTLVVEVQGFNGRAVFNGAGENLKLTERYRRVGETRLEYQFTIEDDTVWTAPWTGMFHFDLDNGQYELVEYACHEGNYGMTNILSAARAKEREGAQSGGEE